MNYTELPPNEELTVGTTDGFDHLLRSLAALSFLALCFLAYQFFMPDTVDVNQTVTLEDCIITEPVRFENTGGEDPNYFFVLKLRGHNLDFRFYDKYYNYSSHAWLVSKLKEWDTVSIQLFTTDIKLFNNQYSTGNINLVNLGRHGRFLVDHKDRNARINKSNAKILHVVMSIFAGLMLLVFLKALYHKVGALFQRARVDKLSG